MEKKPERKKFTKFLSDLLFEETEAIDMGPREEKPAPEVPAVQPAPVQEQPAPAVQPVAQPVREEPKPVAIEPIQVVPAAPAQPEQPRTTMQRIDVTQSIDFSSTAQQPRRPEPQQTNESVFRVQGERRKAQPRVQTITADSLAVQKKTQPAGKKPAQQPEKKPARPVYEFQPVISPIFGVDEKDLNALKSTTSKLNQAEKEKARKNDNINPIISPIYGRDQEDSPVTIQKSVEKSNIIEQMTVTAEKTQAEEEIPNFSLDDILNIGDEQYEKNRRAGALDDTAPLFNEDDSDEGNDDDTMLISRAEYERLRRGGNNG
ncbi:MAG: hypothetical protein IKG46_03170 [Solobacterium sp.]|nr:hypothetical protein [Solobacterium sp.]